MMIATHRNKYLLGLAAGLCSFAAAGVASATPSYIQLLDRCELDYEINPGPGEPGLPGEIVPHACGPQAAEGFNLEQGMTDYIMHENGDVSVITVFMSSRYYNGNGNPTNGHCTAIRFSKDGLPQVTADKQLTDFDGDRPFNHVAVKHIPGLNDRLWVAYGSDKNNNNPQTFVMEVDALCNMGDEIKVSNNNNNQEGAPYIDVSADGSMVGVAYGSNGGNDDGHYIVTMPAGELTVLNRKRVINNSNIPRPTVVEYGGGWITCGAQGDNRPPEDGVQCAYSLYDGTIMWKQYLAESDPGNDIYANNPSVFKLGNGMYGGLVSISNGQGKNNNNKGASETYMTVFQPNDTGFVTMGVAQGLGSFQTHAGGFGAAYGPDGERGFAIFTAPITGSAPALLQVGFFRNNQIVFNEDTKWVPSYVGDSGYLSNIYGQDPNNSGRDFIRGMGDIPNPGFGNPEGFWPNVKTMIAAPHSGRITGDYKNAMWLGLIPGETTVTAVPEPPQDLEDAELGVEGEGETKDPEDFNPDDGDEVTDPDQPGNPNTDQGGNFGNTNTGGCACSTPGTESATGGWAGALALLGLAGMMASRRRKES